MLADNIHVDFVSCQQYVDLVCKDQLHANHLGVRKLGVRAKLSDTRTTYKAVGSALTPSTESLWFIFH